FRDMKRAPNRRPHDEYSIARALAREQQRYFSADSSEATTPLISSTSAPMPCCKFRARLFDRLVHATDEDAGLRRRQQQAKLFVPGLLLSRQEVAILTGGDST